MRTGRALGAVLLWLAALAVAAAPADQPADQRVYKPIPQPDYQPAYQKNAFEEQVDTLVYDGFEHPARALMQLQQLLARPVSADQRRLLLLAIGSIQAQAGASVQAGLMAEQLLALGSDDARAVAASNLVRAQLAENAGQVDVAAALAQSALPAFQAGCPNASATALAAPSTAASAAPASAAGRSVGCDYRSAWRVLQILERRAMSQGIPVSEAAHAQAALALAAWAGDARRQAINLGTLALLAQTRREADQAMKLLAQARHLAQQTGDLADMARVCSVEARVVAQQGDQQRSLRLREAARALAAEANAPRLEARMLTNLSDAYARLNRPADALRAAERALPVVRQSNDQRAERVLINNAGIAKIGLGRIAEGKQDLARLLDLWKASGENGREAETLLEFGEALAAAGDAKSAVDLYHREREISAALMAQNRSVALKELQTRSDADARRRDIELLARDNALKTEALAIRDLRQRMWWLLAALMLLAIATVALLYRRVRETNRRLAASHVQLREQSERDPLTNLANRRHFQAVMAGLAADGGAFEGALLLVDIDHFKRINDVHGHAAGDQVLVEVARRLEEAVRGDDLVVRWGGEEFLILAPRAAPEQAEAMAARVLRTLAQTPIAAGTPLLRVTASIGYGRFPLPPYNSPVPWEQAINLADMALYIAKSQGRNRAVGITSTTAAGAQALHAVEADFDRAWHEGRVTLLQTPGPASADVLRVA